MSRSRRPNVAPTPLRMLIVEDQDNDLLLLLHEGKSLRAAPHVVLIAGNGSRGSSDGDNGSPYAIPECDNDQRMSQAAAHLRRRIRPECKSVTSGVTGRNAPILNAQTA